MKLVYTTDCCGRDILVDNKGNHQVMMEWEKPYMKACIDFLDISGDVLEIGFGLGYSARKICSSPNITSYTIIECSPQVWEKVELFKQEFSHIPIHLIKGRWQDVLCLGKTYDRCFFDDYSGDRREARRFLTFMSIFFAHNANLNCQLGFYQQGRSKNENALLPPFSIDCLEEFVEEFPIHIPDNCKYAKKCKMYLRKLIKRKECKEEDFKIDIIHPLEYANVLPIDVNKCSRYSFALCGGAPPKKTFQQLEQLYHKREGLALKTACEEYIQANKVNNRQLRMVNFFYGFSLFESHSEQSKDVFKALLETEDLEDDIRSWTSHNLQMLGS
jgi:hypothetical protein